MTLTTRGYQNKVAWLVLTRPILTKCVQETLHIPLWGCPAAAARGFRWQLNSGVAVSHDPGLGEDGNLIPFIVTPGHDFTHTNWILSGWSQDQTRPWTACKDTSISNTIQCTRWSHRKETDGDRFVFCESYQCQSAHCQVTHLAVVKRIPFTPPNVESATKTGIIHHMTP